MWQFFGFCSLTLKMSAKSIKLDSIEAKLVEKYLQSLADNGRRGSYVGQITKVSLSGILAFFFLILSSFSPGLVESL